MSKQKELTDTEKFIIGQALTDYDGTNIEEMLYKVGRTAVSLNLKAMNSFEDLMKLKSEKLLHKKWIEPKKELKEYSAFR